MATLDELVKEYLTLNELPQDKATVTKLNKVKELIGEEGARAAGLQKYGAARTRPVLLPRRGSKGAPILDILYELEGGHFVLVESKYGTSQLGRVADRHVYLVGSGGQMTPLPLRRQVEQLDALWVKDRIAEIEKQDPALAKRLREAVEKEKLNILEVRSELQADGTVASKITDHTERFLEQARSGRRFTDEERRITDAERRAARREALSERHLKPSQIKAKQDQKSADKAKSDADKAQKKAEKAKAELETAEKNPRVKEKTKQAKRTAFAEQEKIVSGGLILPKNGI